MPVPTRADVNILFPIVVSLSLPQVLELACLDPRMEGRDANMVTIMVRDQRSHPSSSFVGSRRRFHNETLRG